MPPRSTRTARNQIRPAETKERREGRSLVRVVHLLADGAECLTGFAEATPARQFAREGGNVGDGCDPQKIALDSRWRSARGASRKDGSGERPRGAHCTAGVRQLDVVRGREGVRVRPERAGRAGVAVLGRSQVALDVVVLDLLGHQDDGEERQRRPGEPSNTAGHTASCHCYISMIRPSAGAPQTIAPRSGLRASLGLSWTTHGNSL